MLRGRARGGTHLCQPWWGAQAAAGREFYETFYSHVVTRVNETASEPLYSGATRNTARVTEGASDVPLNRRRPRHRPAAVDRSGLRSRASERRAGCTEQRRRGGLGEGTGGLVGGGPGAVCDLRRGPGARHGVDGPPP